MEQAARQLADVTGGVDRRAEASGGAGVFGHAAVAEALTALHEAQDRAIALRQRTVRGGAAALAQSAKQYEKADQDAQGTLTESRGTR